MAKAAKRVTEKVTIDLFRGGESESKTTLVTSARLKVGDITVYLGPDKRLMVEQRAAYSGGSAAFIYPAVTPAAFKVGRDQRTRIEFELE